MIHRTPFFLPLLYPNLVWKIPTATNELFLTFDDGPVPGPTEFVLETLHSFNANATFFCIGDNVRKHPEVFQKIIRAGHTVGNHTFNHVKGWRTSVEDYLSNIKECETVLENAHQSGHAAKLFRPPYGRITRAQIKALPNYRIIMWDVLSMDYNRSLSPEQCLKKSISATRPGSIIVFHDSVKAEKNMTYVLPRYIEHFLAKGFSFKSLGT